MVAINSFCYRAYRFLKETETKDREIKKIKGIVKNNNCNTNIVDKVMESINMQKAKNEPKQKNYARSLTYVCLLYTSRCV